MTNCQSTLDRFCSFFPTYLAYYISSHKIWGDQIGVSDYNGFMRIWFKRLKFEWRYWFDQPPWDTGISPPELMEYLASHPPGRALDLGCGTGTNLVTMAKAGWQVYGVDFSRRAIALARKKLTQHDLKADLLVESVTNLHVVMQGFDLILDIGCYHQLEKSEREKYLDNIRRLLKQNGDFLVYAHYKKFPEDSHGIDELDVEQFLSFLRLIRRTEGWERSIRPSVWLWFHKDVME